MRNENMPEAHQITISEWRSNLENERKKRENEENRLKNEEKKRENEENRLKNERNQAKNEQKAGENEERSGFEELVEQKIAEPVREVMAKNLPTKKLAGFLMSIQADAREWIAKYEKQYFQGPLKKEDFERKKNYLLRKIKFVQMILDGGLGADELKMLKGIISPRHVKYQNVRALNDEIREMMRTQQVHYSERREFQPVTDLGRQYWHTETEKTRRQKASGRERPEVHFANDRKDMGLDGKDLVESEKNESR